MAETTNITEAPAPAKPAPAKPAATIMYTVRGADGKITYTNDPEIVRVLLVKGGTLMGN